MKSYICKKKILATLVVLFLIMFSWIGDLDKYSDEYTSNAIVEAGSAYAVARGINAVVSILQTSTINVGMGVEGSITIGEVLDPLNDLIERFSQVMTVALSSLVLQKLLLIITANKLFSSLLTLLGALSILMIWKSKIGFNPIILKLFILLVVVRFSLGFAVLANSAVDHMFLSKQIEESSAKLNDFQTSVRNLQRETELSKTDISKIRKSMDIDNTRLEKLNTQEIPILKKSLNELSKKLIEANSNLDKLKDKLDWWIRLNPLNVSPEINQAKETVYRLENEKDAIENKIEEKELLVEELRESLHVKEAHLNGDEEGFVDQLMGIKHNLSPSIIEAKLSVVINDIFKLLVLFILATILIPLLFFYLFIGLAKEAWKTDWEQVAKCNKQ